MRTEKYHTGILADNFRMVLPTKFMFGGLMTDTNLNDHIVGQPGTVKEIDLITDFRTDG
jgi:hypothetical protein